MPESAPPPLGKPRATTSSEQPTGERLAVIEQALQGGNRAFNDLRNADDAITSKIAVIESKITPKPTNWITVGGSMFGVVVVVLTAWWALSNMFSERPTRDEIDRDRAAQKIIDDTQREEIREIREQQIEQRVLMKSLTDTLTATNAKLDVLVAQRRIVP